MRDEKIVRDEILGRAAPEDQALLLRLRSEDRDFDEWCSSVETEVIDEYVQGELTPGDREQFERVYLVNEDRRRKVEFARTLFAAHRKPERLGRWWWAMAASIVLLAAGFVWFARRPQPVVRVHATLAPRLQRGTAVQVVEIPVSALVLEIDVAPGRTATLFLSGERQPLLSTRIEGRVVRIPTAGLEETEYMLVVSDEQPVEHYVFRVVRQPAH